jgi:hypothetical protein
VLTSDNDGAVTEANRFFVFIVDPGALPTFVRQKAAFRVSAKQGVAPPRP